MFVSDKLKYFMASHQVSITQLAANIKVSPSTISEILNGIRSNPRPETIHTLAKFFGVDISEFYDDEISRELSSNNKQNIYFPDLKTALSHLLIKSGIISTASLHKISGIPKYNLDRILNGDIINPSMTTMQQIANFFNITVPQLKGMDPIYSKTASSINLSTNMLPLIPLSKLTTWLSGNFNGEFEYVNISRKIIGKKSFAILVNTDTFEPDFDKETIIVIDSDSTPKNKDFIVTTLKNCSSVYEFSTNKLREAGAKSYIAKPNNIYIYGVVVQEIINIKE